MKNYTHEPGVTLPDFFCEGCGREFRLEPVINQGRPWHYECLQAVLTKDDGYDTDQEANNFSAEKA